MPTLAKVTAMKPSFEDVEPMQKAKPVATAKRGKKNLKPNNDMWQLTITGLYGGKARTQYVEKLYKVMVTMPDRQVEKGAMHQFLRNYAPRLMPALYPDFQNLFTFDIVEATCSNPDKEANNIQVMSREALANYVTELELPIDLELYVESAELRQAIVECTSPNSRIAEAFEDNQEKRKERMGEKLQDATAALDYIQVSIENSRKLKKQALVEDNDDL